MKVLVVLAALLAVTCAAATQQKAAVSPKRNPWDGWTKPSFCRGLDCPPFTRSETESTDVSILIQIFASRFYSA